MDAPLREPLTDAPLTLILFADAVPASETLSAWQQHLPTLKRPAETLLVYPMPDHVEDAPGAFTYAPDQGFVVALRQAIHAAQHPIVVLCPGDNQYRPADVAKLLKTLDTADAVVGYRPGLPPPGWRQLLDRLLSIASRILLGTPLEPRRAWYGAEGWGRRWLARWLFGLRVTDPECAFRVFRREVLQRIPLQSRSSFVFVEMLAKANHMECLLAEEPVAWTPPAQVAAPDSYSADAKAVFRRPEFALPKSEAGTGE